MIEAAQGSRSEGKLLIAYSDNNGSTIGVEYASVASTQANFLMGVSSVAASDKQKRIVTSSALGNTDETETTNDGGDDMEKRIAVLEAEVAHIKSDVAELKGDVKKIRDDVATTTRDMAVVLQKLVDIDANLLKKPSTSEMSSAISSAANKQICWTIGVAFAILGIAKYIF